MKKYFTHNGTEQQGPFDIVDLRANNITRETKIWFDGLPEWTTAGELEELKTIFASTPPPLINTPSKTFEVGKALGKSRWWVTPTIILAIGAVLAVLTANSGGTSDEAAAFVIALTVFILIVFFIWRAIGGLKVFSVLSIFISVVAILSGLFIAYIGIEKSNRLYDEVCNYNQFSEMLIVTGGGLAVVGIYLLAYSITVLALVRKNKLGQYENK